MKIAISGASGLIGSALSARRASLGDRVVPMKRNPDQAREEKGIYWNPDLGLVDEAACEGADVVVHLAGENLAAGWWTEARKASIRESRVRGTWLVSKALAHLKRRPRLLLVASAVGIYGDRGSEVLTEDSPAGEGFLSAVSQEWEAAAEPAREAGIRVVHLRFGIVLARHGGMLGRLLPLFRAGLGGRAGDGKQVISWVALEDVVRVVDFLVEEETLSGPVNVAAPNPVTNAEFSSTLARVLKRPAVLAVPAPILRLTMGQMAEEMVLISARALPRRLTETGFSFAQPELEPALRKILQKT